MELNYLKEFLVLVETRYYAEAAEKLFISPSSLTRHVQALEKELGKPVFVRTSRKVALTDFGKAFLPYAKKIISVQEDYSTNLLIKMRRDEKIIVGYMGGVSLYDTSSQIARFKRNNPDIELEYIQIRPEWQFDMLRDNVIDFLLTGEDIVPKDEFNCIICDRDYFVAVVPATHPLANKEHIDLSELRGEKLALMAPLADAEGAFMTCCKNAGLQPDFAVVDVNNIIDHAAIGGKVVIMAKKPADFFADRFVSVIDIEPKLITEMALIYRKSPALSSKEKRFLDYFETASAEE